MLLLINIQEYQPRKVVQYFEVVKEKAPELVLTFDDLLVDRPGLPRHRRVRAGLPRLARGRSRRATWRTPGSARCSASAARRSKGSPTCSTSGASIPNTASIESDFFGLSQVLAQHAGQAITDPALRRELADAGVTRSELLLQAIRLIQVVPGAVAQEPAGRRGEPGPGRRVPRAGGLRGGRQALGAVRQALPEEHVPRQLPVQRGPGRLPPRPVRPRHRGGRDDRHGDVQGRRRRRPAEPEQVAGALHPRPDLRRPPPAGQGARAITSRSPSGSPTPPARSSRYTRKELKLPEVTVVRPAAAAGGRRRGRPARRVAACRGPRGRRTGDERRR